VSIKKGKGVSKQIVSEKGVSGKAFQERRFRKGVSEQIVSEKGVSLLAFRARWLEKSDAKSGAHESSIIATVLLHF
jgi:hypothetical protein